MNKWIIKYTIQESNTIWHFDVGPYTDGSRMSKQEALDSFNNNKAIHYGYQIPTIVEMYEETA